MSVDNLERVLARANKIDIDEGKLAYRRYNQLSNEMARHFSLTMDATVSVIAALSPNCNYRDNVRSAYSVLKAYREGRSIETVKVATYNHCRDRAWTYLHGTSFIDTVKGPKIRNFYYNIMFPELKEYVTIDGHAVNMWYDKIRPLRTVVEEGGFKYEEIATGFKQLAGQMDLIPNQLQAILWFVWKRIHNIYYVPPQHHLWIKRDDDFWQTKLHIEDIKEYGKI